MFCCLSMSTRWTGACRATRRSRAFCDGTSYRRSSPPAWSMPCAACSIRASSAPSRPTGSRDRSTDCFASSGIKSTPTASCAWSRAARPVTERRPTCDERGAGVRRRSRAAAEGHRDRRLSGSISRETPSLVGAFDAEGENIQLALELAEIFGGEIDFNSDLQPGDRIDVLFERFTRDDEFVGYGAMKAAVLVNGGRRIVAVGFTDTDGRPAWYDEHGRSLKRQFLQSPLPFDPRVTSRFSYRRLHPVHGTTRAHLGVDYGAPAGTPVKAVASGVVELAGWSGEAGRMVRIRHAGGYETVYLHLSPLARASGPASASIRATRSAASASSGTATGPHLDYRIIKNGTYVNPIARAQENAEGRSDAPDAREAFERARDAVLARFPQGETALMSQSSPFRALRPAPETAARVAALPYDVVIDRRSAGDRGRESAEFPARHAVGNRSAARNASLRRARLRSRPRATSKSSSATRRCRSRTRRRCTSTACARTGTSRLASPAVSRWTSTAAASSRSTRARARTRKTTGRATSRSFARRRALCF